MKLIKLVKIIAGYQIRGRIESVRYGNACIVQMKDVDVDTGIQLDSLAQITIEEKKTNWLAQGNVLFVARGYRNFAVLVEHPMEKTIAAPQLFVLKTDPDIVHPAYLVYYLNSRRTQRYFKKMSQSTSLPNITRSILENVPFVLPPLREQEKMATIYRLMKQEQQLYQQIQAKRQVLVEKTLERSLEKYLVKA